MNLSYLDDGLLVGPNGPEVWFNLPTKPYETLSYDERCRLVHDEAATLRALREADFHLLVVGRHTSVDRWAERLLENNPRAADGWPGWVATLREYLDGGGRSHPEVFMDTLERYLGAHNLSSREVYLGVRLQSSKRSDVLEYLLSGVDRRAGMEDPWPGAEEVDQLHVRASRVLHSLTGGRARTARFATASELRWLVQRAHTCGIDDPEEPASRPAWGGELMALEDGLVANGYRWLQMEPDVLVKQPALRAKLLAWLKRQKLEMPPPGAGGPYVSTLSFGHMPQKLEIPGGEWLYQFDVAPFPVWASIRGRVVPPRQAAKDVGGSLSAARDQAANMGTEGELTKALEETLTAGRELEWTVQRGQRPLVYCWPRLVVPASTLPELEERVAVIIRMYQDLGIELVRSGGDQLRLHKESRVGDRLRVPSYQQQMDPETLAGGLYVASTNLSDKDAPYIGVASGSGHSTVDFDLLYAAAHNQPTVITYTGPPGGGKSYGVKVNSCIARMEGAMVLHVDPSPTGEVAQMADMHELGNVRVIELDEHHAGRLDPFRILPDNPDQAGLLAADLCRQFLSLRLGREVEEDLVQAAGEVARSNNRSLDAVVKLLAESGEEQVFKASRALTNLAQYPMARMCFTREAPKPLELVDSYTVMMLQKIRLPDVAALTEDYTIEQRLGVGLMHAVFALVEQLMYLDLGVPKVVNLDEVHLMTRSGQGLRLVDNIARSARKTDTTLQLATQLVGDLLKSQLQSFVTTKFGFRCTDRSEIENSCKFFGMEPTPYHIGLWETLRDGECFMQNRNGHVGRMQFDAMLRSWNRAFDTTPKRGEQVA